MFSNRANQNPAIILISTTSLENMLVCDVRDCDEDVFSTSSPVAFKIKIHVADHTRSRSTTHVMIAMIVSVLTAKTRHRCFFFANKSATMSHASAINMLYRMFV